MPFQIFETPFALFIPLTSVSQLGLAHSFKQLIICSSKHNLILLPLRRGCPIQYFLPAPYITTVVLQWSAQYLSASSEFDICLAIFRKPRPASPISPMTSLPLYGQQKSLRFLPSLMQSGLPHIVVRGLVSTHRKFNYILLILLF